MKILFIGALNPVARLYQRKNAFEDIRYCVTAISWVPKEQPFGCNPSLIGYLLWKIGVPPDFTKVKKFCKKLERLITIFSGLKRAMGVSP